MSRRLTLPLIEKSMVVNLALTTVSTENDVAQACSKLMTESQVRLNRPYSLLQSLSSQLLVVSEF